MLTMEVKSTAQLSMLATVHCMLTVLLTTRNKTPCTGACIVQHAMSNTVPGCASCCP